MYKDKKICIVVPAYNEEMLIEETLAYMPDFVDKIYVIDDCSRDGTPQILNSLAKTNFRLYNIRHEVNKGVGASIITGYKIALRDGMDIAVVMAGDNQMDPSYLQDFLDPIIAGIADYTKGNRLVTPGYSKGMSPLRFFGNYLLTFLTKIASGYWDVLDPQNGYTAISATALRMIDLDSIYPRYGYCNNILTKMNVHGLKIMNIPHPARYGSEKSKIRYRSYIIRVSNLLLADFLWRLKVKYVVTNFHPLVIFYLFGAILSVMGLFGGAYSLFSRLFYSVPIFEKGILSIITTAFGVQLILFAMVFDMMHERQHNGHIFTADPFSLVTPHIDKTIGIERSLEELPLIKKSEEHMPEQLLLDTNLKKSD
jgi:glycosyltransferase involved in cell wall biosynthesis